MKKIPDIPLVISTRRLAFQFIPLPFGCSYSCKIHCDVANAALACRCQAREKARPNAFSFIQSIVSLMSFFRRNLLQPLWRLSEVLDFSAHVCVNGPKYHLLHWIDDK